MRTHRKPAGGPSAVSPGKESLDAKKGMTRREFVIRLGAGTGAGIAGFFLLKNAVKTGTPKAASPSAVDFKPRLKDKVVFGASDGMTTLRLAGDENAVLCAINDIGASILRMLDGNRTVADISRRLSSNLRIPRTEETDANIAYFLTQVSMLGFLTEPFYACIVEVAES